MPSAHAYIDAGSGSFMIQMLVASVIGAGITIKIYFKSFSKKIKSLFSSKSAQDLTTHSKEKEEPK
jgi:hypothetical protein